MAERTMVDLAYAALAEEAATIDLFPRLKAALEEWAAARDEQRTAIEKAAGAALAFFDEFYPAGVFDGSSGDDGAVRVRAIREMLRTALAANG